LFVDLFRTISNPPSEAGRVGPRNQSTS